MLAVRYRRLYPPVIGVTGVLYTIPSLALFVFLIPWTGLSRTTAIIPLVAYTLLILIRNIVAGLDGVPPEVREAAQGMGYRRLCQLFSVELPLALPAIVAGLRIATVTTIGLITVTALIGQGGLGQFMIDGFQTRLPHAAHGRDHPVGRVGGRRRPAVGRRAAAGVAVGTRQRRRS